MKKPPKIWSYDGTEELDKHVEHVDNILNYYHTQGIVKCKFCALTLIGAAMRWFKTLPYGSVGSWKDICDTFIAQFISQKQPFITMVILSKATQKNKEALHN